MRLLFVDDEPQVLRGMQRMLEAALDDWECKFVNTGAEALDAMDGAAYDAIVSDMRMPGMDGAKLLEEVARQHPEAIRIVLSGEVDKSSMLRVMNTMHQYLAKPCSAETLKTALLRARELRNVLQNEALSRLLGGITSVASMPDLYLKLREEIESAHCTATGVGRLLSQDPGMTAKILKLVNSAVFGLARPVSSVSEASQLLGMETIKSLVLTAGIFDKFESPAAKSGLLATLFEHSLRTAQLSSRIARAEKLNSDAVQEAFTAGLLHDVGKLILACNTPELCEQAAQVAARQELPMWEAEREVLGASHAAVGAHLLNLWGLPVSIVEIVALHHSPMQSHDDHFTIFSATCAANLLSDNGTCSREDLRNETWTEYWQAIGCAERLDAWSELCADDGE